MTTTNAILAKFALGMPWATVDPFLFCVHHLDHYPAGNAALGPAASLAGRNIGMDFEGRDGWRMYHGDVVPGFPQHPHRGFETITFVRQGYIDHADSLGATARYGHGDCQWMTAGRGIVHSEMFPLTNSHDDNPVELFQIWLNLPARTKMVEPEFLMLWNESIPKVELVDDNGVKSELTVVAGRYQDAVAPTPPTNSWASEKDADVAVWTLRLEPGAVVALPPANAGTNRVVFFFAGNSLSVDGQPLSQHCGVQVKPDVPIELRAGHDVTEVLLLQGRPIGEPVVQHGPFVMNSQREIAAAFADYQRTQFGKWPWKNDAPVHAPDDERFAIFADGRRSTPRTYPTE